jgi:hypothetical protein
LQDSQSRGRVKYGHEFHRTGNQEWLCWRGPAAVYLSVCLSVLLLTKTSKLLTRGIMLFILVYSFSDRSYISRKVVYASSSPFQNAVTTLASRNEQ